jgi:hypothetical protein
MRAGAGVDGGVACEVAGPELDAAAHLLAHVAIPASAPALVRASSLHDPRYVAWAAAALGRAATAPAAVDGPLLGALLASCRNGHLLQALLELHADAQAMVRAATRDLEALTEAPLEGVARDATRLDRGALTALRELARERADVVEIARCALGLLAIPYVEAWSSRALPELDASRAAVERALAEVATAMPSLAARVVRLSHPMGRHGRGLTRAIAVGAPAPWNGRDAAQAAALVAHEHAASVATGVVGRSVDEAGARWRLAERLALDASAARLRSGEVATAHRAFVATLDLSALPVVASSSLLTEVLDLL